MTINLYLIIKVGLQRVVFVFVIDFIELKHKQNEKRCQISNARQNRLDGEDRLYRDLKIIGDAKPS